MSENCHILVIRLSAMGDAAMTVPVLRAFAKQYPNVKITVVSRPFFEPFFDEIANVDFFAADLAGRHKGFLGLLRLFSDLRKLNINAVADLHNVLRSKIIRNLFALSGAETAAVNKGRAEKKALTRLRNKVFRPLRPMVLRYADTFEKIGFPIDLNNPTFPKKDVFDTETQAIAGEKTQKWIGIAPFAHYQSKTYPLDLMAKVVERLTEKEVKIFLFGAKNEISELSVLQNNLKNVVVLAGKLSLKQELNLIANLDIMLSMDSANAHLAAMFGIKTITLWGSTHPFAGFKPFNQPDDFCLTADRTTYPLLPTSVYGNKTVLNYENVMRSITPESVVLIVEENM